MGDDSTDRRAFLRRAAFGAATLAGGTVATGLAVRGHAEPGDRVVPPPAPPPVAHGDVPPAADEDVIRFLGPIAAGTALGAWSIARVHGVFRGALPFVLAHDDGRRVQVDLMARDDGAPAGVATTATGALYVVNAGRGATETPADLEASTRTLAAMLRAREAVIPAPALHGFGERHRRYPGGVFVIAT